jgi:hypothetical protein
MIEKVKFKSLDFGEKVSFTDKSAMDVEASNTDALNAAYRDLTAEGASVSGTLADPFLLTRANNAVFFGPAQTLAAPSTSFGLFMSMISAKPRASSSASTAGTSEKGVAGSVASSKSLKDEGDEIGPVTEDSLMKKFLVCYCFTELL